jgi:hypothetical protein
LIIDIGFCFDYAPFTAERLCFSMIATGERPQWIERIDPLWRSPFAENDTTPTPAYTFEAGNGVKLSVVPEHELFRYDGGARQMGSAEVKGVDDAEHLLRLDTGMVPARLRAVSSGVTLFTEFNGRVPNDVLLHTIVMYWGQLQQMETIEVGDTLYVAVESSLTDIASSGTLGK